MNTKVLLLVLEDDEIQAKILRTALRSKLPDIEFILAEDGQKFLGKLAGMKRRPSICILDINTPIKNGFEVLETVRRQPKYDRMPCVMFTTSDSAYDRNKAKELGATDYCVKPPLQEMGDKLKALIDKHVVAEGDQAEASPELDTWSRLKQRLRNLSDE